MKSRIKNVKRIVKELLNSSDKLKDSDKKLVQTFHIMELAERGIDKALYLSYYPELTSHDTITRMRRQLQALHPELRGAKYKERYKKQTEVKEDLRNGK